MALQRPPPPSAPISRADARAERAPTALAPARGAGQLASANATVGWDMGAGWLRASRPVAGPPAEGEGHVGREGVRPVATSTVDGVTRSCSAVCTHLGGVVRWEPHAGTWACPLHGSRFDRDGRVEAGPATRALASD